LEHGYAANHGCLSNHLKRDQFSIRPRDSLNK
jgi:hypothetical protein